MLMQTILVGERSHFAGVRSKSPFNPLQLSASVNALEFAALKPRYGLPGTGFGFKLIFCL